MLFRSRKGYNIYPVNSNRAEVDGDEAYSKLAEIPEKPTIVNIVVPPSETVQILEESLAPDLMNIWLQPGAESPEIMAFLQEHDFNYLANACIMIESRLSAR